MNNSDDTAANRILECISIFANIRESVYCRGKLEESTLVATRFHLSAWDSGCEVPEGHSSSVWDTYELMQQWLGSEQVIIEHNHLRTSTRYEAKVQFIHDSFLFFSLQIIAWSIIIASGDYNEPHPSLLLELIWISWEILCVLRCDSQISPVLSISLNACQSRICFPSRPRFRCINVTI